MVTDPPHTHTHTQTHRQDRLQYTAPELASAQCNKVIGLNDGRDDVLVLIQRTGSRLSTRSSTAFSICYDFLVCSQWLEGAADAQWIRRWTFIRRPCVPRPAVTPTSQWWRQEKHRTRTPPSAHNEGMHDATDARLPHRHVDTTINV